MITTLNGRPILLRNNVGQDNAWIGFSLQGTTSNRDAIGAKVMVTSSGRTITRWITGGSGYLASHDKRVLVGLDGNTKPVQVDIRWPSGVSQHLSDLPTGRYHRILEPKALSQERRPLQHSFQVPLRPRQPMSLEVELESQLDLAWSH